MTCFRAVRYIVSILVVLSLGLFVAAGVLDYWWVSKPFGMEVRKGMCITNLIFFIIKLIV